LTYEIRRLLFFLLYGGDEKEEELMGVLLLRGYRPSVLREGGDQIPRRVGSVLFVTTIAPFIAEHYNRE
jgi:hypothetical protein